MFRLTAAVLIVLSAITFAGAGETPLASSSGTFPIFTGDLSEAKFKVVRTNLSARSSGFWFTCLPMAMSGARDAFNDLVEEAGIEGKENVAFINVVKSTKIICFIVGTIVLTEVRADLIEFQHD